MSLNTLIESAEIQYTQILEDFFASIYDEKSLPSHGIDHHRRVWRYAREIISHNSFSENRPILPEPEKLIISCYLHDLGMSVDRGIKHGIHSRDLCLRFFFLNKLDESRYQDVLEAIEIHDNKHYTGTSTANDLLKILSAADDLDAFGFIGIYRYLEIYMARGTDLYEIGSVIKTNAEVRFMHFAKNFGRNDALFLKHKPRYDILDDFFSGYNDQVATYKFSGKEPSGYCGVVEILDRLIKSGENPREFQSEEQLSDDPVVRWFFRGLKEELTSLSPPDSYRDPLPK